jgi:nucleotide-binding universal stress UspA family protein
LRYPGVAQESVVSVIEQGAQRIVVPVDTSEASAQAIPYVRALAVAGDTVVLLHVVVPPDSGLFGRNQYGSPEQQREAGEAHLHALSARAGFADGVQVETAIVEGRPADAILAYKASTGATLIVMATAGRGTTGRLRFGSVADEVARTANIPVVLVRLRDEEDAPDRIVLNRIVVPLDGSGRANRALPRAELFAKRLQLPITILNVMEISDLTKYEDPDQQLSPVEEIIAVDDQAVRERLSEAVAELEAHGCTASWKIVSGNWAAEVIEDEVGGRDFLVMTSHGRRGLRRWLFGSVAEQLVRSGRSAVMLVPPDADQE